MIVDCHTHIWQSAQQVGLRVGVRASRPARGAAPPEKPSLRLQATPELHAAACKPVDAALVLGFRSRHLDATVPNDFLAECVRRQPGRLIGFAGIDPLDGAAALEEIRRASQVLGLKGLVIAPASQAMHPAHSQAMAVYELAQQMALPLVVHNSPPLSAAAHLEYARPYLLDEVARTFPQLRILITHLGFPWVDETFLLLARHDNVFAEISGITQSPWMALQHMQSAYDLGVMDKLFFGSDFPYSSPKVVIEALYSLAQIVHGTNLPSVPREALRGIVERNSLALLGLDVPLKAAGDSVAGKVVDVEPARPDAVATRPESTL